MYELTLAGLRVHSSVSPAAGAVLPKAGIILLHGYGAPGTDLLALADSLRAPPGTAFFFPEGPLDLAAHFGPGYAQARAWWPIDMVRLQVATMTGAAEDAVKHLATGLDEACVRCACLLDELQARFELAPQKTILGGFSQGSIVSLEVALRDQRSFAGLLLMSSTMLDARRVSDLAPRRAGTRALISHGRADPVLPYPTSESLVKSLMAAQWDVRWVPFEGGHGIPPQVLDTASSLLPQWLG